MREIITFFIFCEIFIWIFDFIVYYKTNRRIPLLLRLPFELVILIIYPLIAVKMELTERLESILSKELFLLLCVCCIISYFVSTYKKDVMPVAIQNIIILFLIIACILNFATSLSIIAREPLGGFLFAIFGNIPLFFLLLTALLEQYRKHVEYEDSTNTDS